MTHIDVQTLTMLGWLVPLIVGLVTKKYAHPAVKALSNLALSAIIGGLAVATQAHGDVHLAGWIGSIVATFGQSIISYYGLWKPTTASALVQNVSPTFGIGTPLARTFPERIGLTYQEIKAYLEEMRQNQSVSIDSEAVTAKQAAQAKQKAASLDDFGNQVLSGAQTIAGTPLHSEPQTADEVPEAKATGALSYEDVRAVVDSKMTNGSHPIVRSDPKTTASEEVHDLDRQEAEEFGLTEPTEPNRTQGPVKKAAKKPAVAQKSTKKAPVKKAPAKKASARKAPRKRASS